MQMQFNSAVTKVEFVGSRFLLGCSEDSTVQLCDLESGKVQSFGSECAHSGSVRNACVDSQVTMLATTGCDGKLHLINLETAKLIKKV